MDRSYALKINTKTYGPYYHFGYRSREEAEKAKQRLELLEGWSCSVVYVERILEGKLKGGKEKYRFLELPAAE